MSYRRHGKKWTIPEVLQLQREYELLNMNLVDIAVKHERSLDSIQYKIESEGFVNKSKEFLSMQTATNVIDRADNQQLEMLLGIIDKRLSQISYDTKIARRSRILLF